MNTFEKINFAILLAMVSYHFTRRTPAVDPGDHHVYVTLGCAAENLVIAANASGQAAKATILRDNGDDPFVSIVLGNGERSELTLSAAIPKRQSIKSEYDGTPVSDTELRQKYAATRQGVGVIFFTERAKLDEALKSIQARNTAQDSRN